MLDSRKERTFSFFLSFLHSFFHSFEATNPVPPSEMGLEDGQPAYDAGCIKDEGSPGLVGFRGVV